MTLTSNEESILWQLRALMPKRPLTQFEAYRLAELQANRLLDAAGVHEVGTPDRILHELAFLDIGSRSQLPVSGLTTWRKPHWRIVLNASEPAVRRRFSLYHEFKHVLDHGIAERAYPTTRWGSADDRSERVCDYFAAAVLMPKRLVKRRFFEGLSEPSELAAEFGVSPQAMRFRLEQLKLVSPLPRCGHARQTPEGLTGYFRTARLLEAAA